MEDGVRTALGTYSNALFDVYQQQCGDGATFWEAEPGFEVYLSHRRFDYGPYNDVKNLNASPEEAAQVFKEYLGGGRNCPDASLRGTARQIASDFHVSMRSTVTSGADGDMHYTSNPQKLYSNWQKYVNLYLGAVAQLKHAADRFVAQENLDYLVVKELRNNAIRAEIIAEEMWRSLKEIGRDEFMASQEGSAIRSNYPRIINFRGLVKFIGMATEPGSEYVSSLNEFVDLFESGFQKLQDPLDWINKVALDFFQQTQSPVVLDISMKTSPLRIENTPMMWELLDRVAMAAADVARDTGSGKIAFRWDYLKRHFVIVTSTLGRHAQRIDEVLAVLNGWRSGDERVEIRVPAKKITAAPQAGRPPSEGNGISSGEQITGADAADDVTEFVPGDELAFEAGFDVYAAPDLSPAIFDGAVVFPL